MIGIWKSKAMPNLVSNLMYDTKTGIPFVEDTRGNMHMVDWNMTSCDEKSPRVYLQSDLSGYRWATTQSYLRVPDSFRPGNFLVYTVPPSYRFHLSSLVVSCAKRTDDRDRLSFLGITVNDVLSLVIPFLNKLDFPLPSPIVYDANTKIEFLYKPGRVSMDLGIIVGGYLVKSG